MSPRYKIALAEVDYVINLLESSELKKIPDELRDFIVENKDRYVKITSIKSLKEETLAILAIIYRKYLSDPNERALLEKEYIEKLRKKEN